jgi:hypothetical protein
MTARVISGYDVIGDVHGHVHAVEGLLAQMGYSRSDGVWLHPTRTAVFVGDLVDRGAFQVETVRLVQAMVAAGTALIAIGNHEYNAVAWTVPSIDNPDDFCRSHDDAHLHQHHEFLRQVGEGSDLHRELVDWFCTLPLWLELDLDGARLRVVHACWSAEQIAVLAPLLSATGTLTVDAVQATARKDSAEHNALEVVLKGPEVNLTGDRKYAIVERDLQGNPKGEPHFRPEARVRWWDATATTLDRAAIVPHGAQFEPEVWPDFPHLPAIPVEHVGVYTDDVPVIVGHYWTPPTDPLAPLNDLVACVDYSAAKDGPLVAYRWSGERTLTADHFVAHHFHHPSPDDVAGAEPDID